MYPHDLALAAVAFASEFAGTLSGFGSSTFFVPMALLFESARFVLALTGILHCFGNLSKIILFRKSFEPKVFLLLSVPFIVFTGIGALLVARFGTESVERVLGIFLVSYAGWSFFGAHRSFQFPRWVIVFLSALSGLSTGFIGTGGAIRGAALSALRMPKESFVAVSSSIDIGGDLLRTFIYLQNGFMRWDQWFYIPVLALTAYAGARLGQLCLRRVNQAQFEKVVSLFLLISGLMMLI